MTTEAQAATTLEVNARRSERAAVALTKAEKDALRLVALIDETNESELLRDFTIAAIVERATVIRSRHR